MADYPPTFPVNTLNEALISRCHLLQSKFIEKFGRRPTLFARASGRVNLIGEHIDYCGYAVLPMAIEQDVIMALACNDENVIRLSNVDDSRYSDFSAPTTSYTIDKSSPKWYHYFLCGYKGFMERYGDVATVSTAGVDVVVGGTVPPSAGLSSSSALVCCAALATAAAHSVQISKVEMAGMCAQCERYIGTEGGGMDQSIAFLAEHGTAKLIEFNPIRAFQVTLPSEVVFVISNSLVEINKAATSHFNVRVVECRLACQILAKQSGLNWWDFRKLGDLQNALHLSLSEMAKLVDTHLHDGVYTIAEVCSVLGGVSAEELAATSLSQNTLDVKEFKLHDRARHVFTEAERVQAFKGVCDGAATTIKSGGDGTAQTVISELGRLMNESHASCRDLYECSCSDLDQLVEICRASGAVGSRLTGAGWGGCAVSLVPAAVVDEFMLNVKAAYYDINPDRASKVPHSLFATQPGGGAAIFLPSALD